MVSKTISKDSKSKRVDTNLKIKRAPTKPELILQVKALQQANDALEESNRKKIELLESFEAKIQNLEDDMNMFAHNDIMFCKETQTEVTLDYKCEECNFEGQTEKEVGWHMGRFHGLPNDHRAENMDMSFEYQSDRHCDQCGYIAENLEDLQAHTNMEHTSEDIIATISCDFCDHCLKNKFEVMKHKKVKHVEKVSTCWNFSLGKCGRSDESCWFHHSESKSIQCNFCKKTFPNQSQFMNHRKKHHQQSVPTCRNYVNGSCLYTNENC